MGVVDSMTLHWAARRYLMERYQDLSQQYAELPNQGRAEDGYHYSAQAKRCFPRYQVVQAMLDEVERLDPDRLPELPLLSTALVSAAEQAQSAFTLPPQGEIEAEVMGDERRRFGAAVRAWVSLPGLRTEPLGYRRVLTSEESAQWRGRLTRRWDLRDMVWYPLLADPVPADVLVLAEASMWDGPGVAYVRQALLDLGCRRVVELREYGVDYLLDVDLFAPRYTGPEGVWSDDSLTWIAYACHEGAVAFGGVLAGALLARWHELERWRWSGW
jgi:hypothetical protein